MNPFPFQSAIRVQIHFLEMFRVMLRLKLLHKNLNIGYQSLNRACMHGSIIAT